MELYFASLAIPLSGLPLDRLVVSSHHQTGSHPIAYDEAYRAATHLVFHKTSGSVGDVRTQ